MHLPQPLELGVFQPRDEPQHLFLRAPLHVRLEAYHVVERARHVVLAQLHRCPGTAPRARVAQPHRAHGAKGQRFLAACGQRLDRHATLEVAFQLFVGALEFRLGRVEYGLHKARVFFLVERAVDIVALVAAQFALAVVAALAEGHRHVDGVRHHDGRHRVVEIEMLLAGKRLDLGGQRSARQRPRGDDHRPGRDFRHFLAVHRDVGMAADQPRDLLGKVLAGDSQRRAGGQRVLEGGADHQAAHAQQFVLEDAQRAVGQRRAHGIAAHQLGQPVGDVRLRAAHGPHLVEIDAPAALGNLPGRLAPRQPAADNRYRLTHRPTLPTLTTHPPFHASRITHHASRITHHASRITHHV